MQWEEVDNTLKIITFDSTTGDSFAVVVERNKKILAIIC